MVKFRGKQTNQSREAWKVVYSQTDLFVRLGLGWINTRFTLKLSNHLFTDVYTGKYLVDGFSQPLRHKHHEFL